MTPRRLLLPVLLLVLALPATADASRPRRVLTVLGESDGLSLVVRRDTQQIRFAPRAAGVYRRRLARRRVTIRCRFSEAARTGIRDVGESETTVRLPRRPRPVLLGSVDGGGIGDVCRVGHQGVPIAMLPGSDLGRRYLDELTTFGRLFWTLTVGTPDADQDPDAPVPTTQVVERGGGVIVALDGPDAAPPPNRAGYWTDGTRTLYAATTAAGERLYLTGGDAEDVTLNVLGYLTASGSEQGDALLLWRTAEARLPHAAATG